MKCFFAVFFVALMGAYSVSLPAQTGHSTNSQSDGTAVVALKNHVPAWANAQNDAGPVAPDAAVPQLTLVLARSQEQEAVLQQLLADQLNPRSSNYRHWLTPAEFGTRFGASKDQIAQVTAWARQQGLKVNWIAPGGTFIGVAGTAATVNQAFHTQMRNYTVHGLTRMSVSSAPSLAASVAPLVKAVRGLYSIEEQPFHAVTAPQASKPQMTLGGGTYYVAPADFAKIYDLQNPGGQAPTIGIVGRSRTDKNDFTYFQSAAGIGFNLPTEIIPTAFGGADPGPALTSPPSSNVDPGDQLEATLDVQRAGSTSPTSPLLLVVATSQSGGIGADAQYLVQTTPLPAQVMSISFGACESAAGPSGVNYWDTLFQQAAAEGISVFVSSGDSGASGCEAAFSTPQATPPAISPNYICSSSYVTCVGGTEFNDASTPTQYWASTNGANNESALKYIPEGGWNEPLNSKSAVQVAGSGGGVSSVIATPSWQTGTGVPTARSGRYTPDVSFTSSCHDAYFGCMAAAGGSCVPNNGSYYFVGFCGTSAAAPSMAGVAALVDESQQYAVGNMNPQIYGMAANAAGDFHDATPSTSGVASCSLSTPSMCNNSTPGPTGLSGGQKGYALQTGFDMVTGLGSIDIDKFLNDFGAGLPVPTVTVTPSVTTLTALDPLTVTVTVDGGTGNPTPTGTVTLTTYGYSSAAVALSGGSATISIPAKSIAASSATQTLTVRYTPDNVSAADYGSAAGNCSVNIQYVQPTVNLVVAPLNGTTAQDITTTVNVSGPSGAPKPDGSVTLSASQIGVGTVNQTIQLTNDTGSATFPAGTVPAGPLQIGAFFTPTSQSGRIYGSATTSTSTTLTQAPVTTPTLSLTFNPASPGLTDTDTITATVGHASGTPVPSGTVAVAGGSGSWLIQLVGGTGTATINPGQLPIGSTTVSGTYSGDTNFNSASSLTSLTVAKGSPSIQINPQGSSFSADQAITVDVEVAVPPGPLPFPSGTVTLSSGSYTSDGVTLNAGSGNIYIPANTLSAGTDTLTVSYSGDANYVASTSSTTIDVTSHAPIFTVAGSNVTITTPGTSSGNTSTITLTPSNGFTGTVALQASIQQSPTGAQHPPTFSFSPTTGATISGATAVTATMTVSTTAPTTGALELPGRSRLPWLPAGGALACVVLLAVPRGRRGRRALLGLLLLAAFFAGVSACGGGGGGGGGTPKAGGTTPGTYTVKVTGTSNPGGVTASTTLTVVVD